MIRARNIGVHWLAILGWPGLTGAGLVAFAALFYVFAIMPVQGWNRYGRKPVRRGVRSKNGATRH